MISVVLPVYNEEDSLIELHRRLSGIAELVDQPMEFLFVNDGSTDRSAEVIDRIASGDSRVIAVHLRRNFGQTAAMTAGFDQAVGDIIVCLDSDLQNDPSDIPRLLAKLDEGYDVVSGWRRERQDPFFRRVLISRLANRLIGIVSGVHLHDYGCSLKAYRADLIKEVRLYGEMHRFIPIYATWQGGQIAEIPVTHHPRRFGKSNYGLSRTFKVLMDLLVVMFFHKYNQKPMYVFGASGLFSFAVAFLAGGLAIFYKLTGQKSFIETPLPLLAAMATITGVMCFLLGLLAEMLVRTYFESQEKKTYVLRRGNGASNY